MHLERRRLKLATGLEYSVLEAGPPAAVVTAHAGPPAPVATAHGGLEPHTVFLLHGFLDAAAGWVDTIEAGLGAAGFHLVAPDWRGHGDSDWIGPGGYYHFPDYLADLHDLVRQCGRERVSLVGHSMGGSVAAYYAGTFPEDVHKLVLMEGMGPPEGLPTGPERVVNWLRQWENVRNKPQKTYPDLAAAAARLAQLDPLLPPERAARIAAETTREVPGGVTFKHDPLHVTEGPVGFDLAVAERFWRRIACETLLIDGAQSFFRFPPEEAARREGCIARARKIEIPGAGHMIQRHQPAALAVALRDFLLS